MRYISINIYKYTLENNEKDTTLNTVQANGEIVLFPVSFFPNKVFIILFHGVNLSREKRSINLVKEQIIKKPPTNWIIKILLVNWRKHKKHTYIHKIKYYIQTDRQTYIYIYIYIYIHTHTACVCVCVCVCIYIYIYIYTYMSVCLSGYSI